MNFSKKILQVFTSPHSKNVWGFVETLGWRKVQPLTNDGATNMFMVLTSAKSSGIAVSGTINDATNEITTIYL
ncbi:hypothetical protein [Dyadobacter sp. LHD-138]|uniref:hypothetical protein n=1 Tax=Dyadobacter sp. LHD-138 TaxID=3071413 RepID=UPI0027DF13FD|nr:hypothetical protein [Dyadobacter sp. LHD-138]MDQ6478415.1 hypothetical protein [Dyadobacter sp. LHD-138]